MYLIHYIVINVIEKNAPWLAAAKPLIVLVTFVIAALLTLPGIDQGAHAVAT